MKKIGILLTNTGTPDAPTKKALRSYLREFLSDKRVVKLPRVIWLPLLYGVILPLRAQRSAKLYQLIWTKEGSPMRFTMQKLAEKLTVKLNAITQQPCTVVVGMNYGQPGIPLALEKLREQQVDQIIVLPLFPQYSDTTTASSFDRIKKALKRNMEPEIQLISSYARDKNYIAELSARVKQFWQQNSLPQHLLISFHGIPKRYVAKGDTYESECQKTAALLAAALDLAPEKWSLCYQSQFGYDKWLTPSTQALLAELPARGVKIVDVICPGFAVDCLETLEEIALRGAEHFALKGGEKLRYIPALNATDSHAEMLSQIIKNHIKNLT